MGKVPIRGTDCFGQSGQKNLLHRRHIQAKRKDHARLEKKGQESVLHRRTSICKDSEEFPDNTNFQIHIFKFS